MSQLIFPVPNHLSKSAFINEAEYQRLYDWSINDPDAFWKEQGGRLDWFRPFTQVNKSSFSPIVSIDI
jgi:acetyl-CoA synthetase